MQCSHGNYTPHSGKHDVGGGNHDCVRYNVYFAERFLRSNKLIFIHPTTNLYATSAPKTFDHSSAHFDHRFYAPNRLYHAMIQISNFGEDEIVSMFYACGLHLLYIAPMLIIHPRSEKHDVGGGNYDCGMSISRRGFYAVT